MIIGHIGARAGSKGVPGKNFRMLLGKPLIAWSLDQLFAHPEVDHVVVSTDDADIYAYAVNKGALPIGLRPPHLSTDTAAKWDVWVDVLSRVEHEVGDILIFLDLDCTSPLRTMEDISGALEAFRAERPDMVMSVCDARKNPYFNLVEPDETGALNVSKPLATNVVARQQVPLVYEHAASTYVISPDYLKRARSLYEGRVIPYVMPPERCLDIDSEFDWKLVRFLLNESRAKKDKQ